VANRGPHVELLMSGWQSLGKSFESEAATRHSSPNNNIL
jgi:hypothetical protein